MHLSVQDKPPELSVVVPLFNEEENVVELHRRLTAVLGALGGAYEIVLVDDGSRDATPRLIDDLARRDPHLSVVHLSRTPGTSPPFRPASTTRGAVRS